MASPLAERWDSVTAPLSVWGSNEGVDPQWLSPSPKMWRARILQLSVVAGIVMLGAGIGVGICVNATAGIATAVSLAVVAAFFGLLLWRRYRAWGYAEREDDLLVRRGVMIRRLTVVPYGRMQFVDVTAGPVDRIFHLATVQLHTAAAATDARIPGLDNSEAERLRDQLAALGEAKAAGL
jgi:membrane protein YdbS with pleckstrin-like domain